MNHRERRTDRAMQLFEPDPNAVYTLEVAERLARVPRRLIAIYHKHGLVSSITDPAENGFLFDDEGIRTLRRIEYLRSVCGVNFFGVKLIVALMREAEQLRREARFLRTR
jgi:MerR family transcriptional regulator/heat shock protein HspR